MINLHTKGADFFIQDHVDNHDLHSFPTRRSSDLKCLTLPAAINSFTVPATSSAGTAGSTRCRSEEHTCELQSHVNIVCRLLLEKKKFSTWDRWQFDDSSFQTSGGDFRRSPRQMTR